MKRINSAFLVVALLLVGSFDVVASILDRLASKPLPAFQLPPITRQITANGMKLFVVEDHRLPIVQASLYIRSGLVYQPADKVGVAKLLEYLLRSGGTRQYSPKSLEEKIDELAIDISVEMENEYALINLKCERDKLEPALKLFFEILFQPRFDHKRFKLGKMHYLDALKRQNDRPSALADREFNGIIYGRHSPWGYKTTAATVTSLTRRDMTEFYQRFFSPDQMTLAMAGDFKADELIKMVTSHVEVYPASGKKNTPPPWKGDYQPGTYAIEKKLAQTTLTLGHLATSRDDPDMYPLLILDTIIGAAFTGRLPAQVRTQMGYAYEIWSRMGVGPSGVPGIFMIRAKTQPENTQKAAALIGKILSDMVTGKTLILPRELHQSKERILNALIFEYKSPFDIVSKMALYHYFGYPDNYIDLFRQKIEAVTLQDLRRVAKKSIQPEKLSILAVGSGLDEHLAPWGPIIPLSIEYNK